MLSQLVEVIRVSRSVWEGTEKGFPSVNEFIFTVEFQECNFTRHTNELLSFFTRFFLTGCLPIGHFNQIKFDIPWTVINVRALDLYINLVYTTRSLL